MNVIFFKVNMTTAFTHAQLLKSGWNVVEKDKLYTRIKDKYKFSYVIKSFGKIRVSEMHGELDNEETLALADKLEFSFEDAWKTLWNKSYEPESIEIIMKNNYFDQLVENGWKPSATGVIEYITNEYNLSFYYPAPEGLTLYKLVDDDPKDVLNLMAKFRILNIEQS